MRKRNNGRKIVLKSGLAIVVLTSSGLAAMAVQGMIRTGYVDDPVGRNVIFIESRAPLETMVTTTSAVKGEISGDLTNMTNNPKARFEVDMASLDTGIELRNEHMRGADWLDTAKYPKAVFTMTKLYPLGTRLVNGKPGPATRIAQVLQPNKTYRTLAQGTMQMHGKTNAIFVDLEFRAIPKSADTAARLPGDLMHIRAKFPLVLAKFGVDVPPPAKLKIAATQEVTVDIFASTKKLEMPKPE